MDFCRFCEKKVEKETEESDFRTIQLDILPISEKIEENAAGIGGETEKKMELSELRNEVDQIDAELTALFLRRMEVSRRIAEGKASKSLPIQNTAREAAVLEKVSAAAPEELKESVRALYTEIMRLSREYQHSIFPGLN